MTSKAPSRPVTFEDLVRLRIPGELSLHPAENRVAFTLNETDLGRGIERVQIAWAGPKAAGTGETDEPSHVQVTHGIDDAWQPRWSPDGRWLAFLSARPHPQDPDGDSDDGDGPNPQVFVMDAQGGEARRITDLPEGVDLFRWCPDGTAVVALAPLGRSQAERNWRRKRGDDRDDPVVVDEEITTWEFWRAPVSGDPVRIVGGLRGVGDFDIAPSGRELAIETNHTGRPEDGLSNEIVLLDVDSLDMRRPWRERRGQETRPRFLPGGGGLLFAGWSDPGCSFSRQELYWLDPAAEGSHPRSLLEAIDRDMEGFTPLGEDLVAVTVAWGLESRVVLVEPRAGTHRVLPLENLVVPSIAGAAGRLAAVVETAESLPEIASVCLETGTFTTLTELNPESVQWIRARRKRVTWQSEGFEHDGFLVLPPEAPAEPCPLLVWLHGGPHWRAIDTRRVYDVEAFAAAGWAVFVPNYRGSSGYGEEYSTASRCDLGGGDARDVLAGVESVARLDAIDGGRVAVAGASYGGYLVNWLAATSDRFRAAVSIAGIFDLTQDYCSSDYYLWEEHYLGGPPWEAAELYRERSPLTRVRDIHTPLLVLHGLDDENTFFTNGQALYRALRRLGRTAELVLYPREGHGVHEPRHRVDASRRVLDWIERHARGVREVHVTGRAVEGPGLRMQVLSRSVREEYSGVGPRAGRLFCEVSLLVESREHGPENLRLVPCGADADIVLSEGSGDLYRPVGVVLDVHGQQVLFDGRGFIEASRGEAGEPAALPVTVVFELPERPVAYRLHVLDLPPVRVEVSPSHGEGED